MTVVSMKELLEAGVHFGHQSRRGDPKMRKYIYSTRNGIHVIDLHKSIPLIEEAYEFVKNAVVGGGGVLFVGTKKQAQETVQEEAKRCGMFYVNQKWLGGTLTNYKTLKKNIARLLEIEKQKEEGMFEKLPKKEVKMIEREHRKFLRGLDGIRGMAVLPAVVFIIDTQKEQTALKEAKKLNIPVVAVVDTNVDPDQVDFPIPGNDDSIRSIKLLTKIVADAVVAGREIGKPVGEEVSEEEGVIPEQMEEAEAISEEERIAEELALLEEASGKKEKEERVGF